MLLTRHSVEYPMSMHADVSRRRFIFMARKKKHTKNYNRIIKYDTPSESFRNYECCDENDPNRESDKSFVCPSMWMGRRNVGSKVISKQYNFTKDRETYNWQIRQMWSAFLRFVDPSHTQARARLVSRAHLSYHPCQVVWACQRAHPFRPHFLSQPWNCMHLKCGMMRTANIDEQHRWTMAFLLYNLIIFIQNVWSNKNDYYNRNDIYRMFRMKAIIPIGFNGFSAWEPSASETTSNGREIWQRFNINGLWLDPSESDLYTLCEAHFSDSSSVFARSKNFICFFFRLSLVFLSVWHFLCWDFHSIWYACG